MLRFCTRAPLTRRLALPLSPCPPLLDHTYTCVLIVVKVALFSLCFCSFALLPHSSFAYVLRFLTSAFGNFTASVVSLFAVFMPIIYGETGYNSWLVLEKYFLIIF